MISSDATVEDHTDGSSDEEEGEEEEVRSSTKTRTTYSCIQIIKVQI